MSDSQVKKQSTNFETPSRLVNMSQPTPPTKPTSQTSNMPSMVQPQSQTATIAAQPMTTTAPTSHITQVTNAQSMATAPSSQSAPASPTNTQKIQFNSSAIKDPKTAQPDYFADQNKKLAEKKAKNDKTRGILFVIIGSIVGIIIIGLLTWLIISIIKKPEPAPDPEPEEEVSYATSVLEEARENAKENNDSPEATEAFFSEALDKSENTTETNQVLLAQFLYYFNLPDTEKAITISGKINTEELEAGDQIAYYGALAQIYYSLGDEQQANYYNGLSYRIMRELVGTEEEGSEL